MAGGGVADRGGGDASAADTAPTGRDREHFDAVMGLEFGEVTDTRVTGWLVVDERHQQPFGLVHGGVYAGIVESLSSVGGHMWAWPQEMIVVGVSNSTDFLRAHREGRLDAVATPIHQGRQQQLWQCVITRASDDKTVARGQVRLQNLPRDFFDR